MIRDAMLFFFLCNGCFTGVPSETPPLKPSAETRTQPSPALDTTTQPSPTPETTIQPSPTSEKQHVSLCVNGEEAVYSCVVKGGKTVSLCFADPVLRYRFGKPGNVELEYPPVPQPAKVVFKHTYDTFGPSGGESNVISFTNKDVTYEVASVYYGGGEGFDGVWVRDAARKILVSLECGDSGARDFEQLSKIVPVQAAEY